MDSESTAVRAFIEAYEMSGGSGLPPVDEFLAGAGKPFEHICADLRLPPGMPAAFRAGSRRRIGEVRCFPGMEEILRSITEAGIPMAIITGKDRPRTIETLEHLSLGSYFGAIATPDDPPLPKPHPDGVFWLCDLLSASPEQTIVVGDSPHDLRAGRDAGAVTVGCLWGAGNNAALTAERPDYLVNSVAALSAVLSAFTDTASMAPKDLQENLWTTTG